MFSSESIFGPFPNFDPGFYEWETHEPLFEFNPTIPSPQEPEIVVINPNIQPIQEPVTTSNSGSETPNNSKKPNRKRPNNSGSGSSGSDHDQVSPLGCNNITEERKRRRMLSNRESARRSRVRKQNHLENLRNQLNRLKISNRELMNGLRVVEHQNRMVQGENEYLRSEAVMLRQRLWDIRQVLLVRQLQQHLNPSSAAWPACNNNNVTSINNIMITP